MTPHRRSIDRLEALEFATGAPKQDAERDFDPRLTWASWPGAGRAAVLALVDFVAEHAADFTIYDRPNAVPGFDELPDDARALLQDLWRLWGTSRRFPRFIASLVNNDTQVVAPVWAIRALITRATMRRRFRGVLARFARDGDPTYTSHRTYRAENWPERAVWSAGERRYLSKRFFEWDQNRRRRIGELLVADRNVRVKHPSRGLATT
jgi:hypothetical protein